MNSGISKLQATSKILIVEDEWIIALDIQQNLKKLGYIVVGIANTPTQAFELVQTTQPNLVLMDIYLQGGQSGIQAATHIRNQFNLPIIFLTAHADDPTVQEALSAAPYGYVVKPFDVQTLNTSIKIALANHQTDLAVKQALEKEKQINALKSQFVSFVSHEFRNPLSSILITLELLERQDYNIPREKQKNYIHRAKTAVQEMTRLIQDVLLMSEIDREQFQCRPEPIDIYHFCLAIAEDFQIRTQEQYTIRFISAEYSKIQQPYYELDPKLLQHILSNLLDNAIKYSPENSEINFLLECDRDRVIFKIQDQGIGISPSDQENLFTPFYRGSNANHHPGTGLGLSIVKQCVDAHSGVISLESQVGQGSTFIVELTAPSHTVYGLIEDCHPKR